MTYKNLDQISPVFEATVPTNENNLKFRKQNALLTVCSVSKYSFSTFRRKVDDENRNKTICLRYATYNNFHKASQVLKK